jgi:hypothetical protein
LHNSWLLSRSQLNSRIALPVIKTYDQRFEVESVGYSIEGIVADNASINTKMFKMLNAGGKLSNVIPYPIPTAREENFSSALTLLISLKICETNSFTGH